VALLQVAGGDPQLLGALRRLAWEAYAAAGSPCGPDEEGMAAWWSARLRGFSN
jgi:hypothetical protein